MRNPEAKHARAEHKTRLYQCMLYVDSFTVAELARIVDLARSTISNNVNDLRKRGWIEQVEGESSGGGRPRARYRITTDLKKRRAFFRAAYNEAPLDTDAPATLNGEAFATACRLIDDVKIRSTSIPWLEAAFPQVQTKRLIEDLDVAEEYLKVAFYEQTWIAREGLIGGLIQSQYDELRTLRARLSKKPAKTLAVSAPAQSEVVIAVCRRLLGKRPSYAQERAAAEQAWATIRSFTKSIGRRLKDVFSELDAFRFAVMYLAPKLTEQRLFAQTYNEIDAGWSFDALYNRTCMNLLAGDYEGAEEDWEQFGFHSLSTALGSKTLLEVVKSYIGLVCESHTTYRVAAVATEALPTVYESVAGSEFCSGPVEIATADPFYLSLATGDHSHVELGETMPIELGTVDRKERQLPLPSQGRRLAASKGIAPFLDVPGPISMKLAVGLDGVGVERRHAFEQACSFDSCQSYVFVPTEDEDSELPQIKHCKWLPVRSGDSSNLVETFSAWNRSITRDGD